MQAFLKHSKPITVFLTLLLMIEWIPLQSVQAGEDLTVRNLRFEASGDVIVVTYDMQGPDDEKFRISLLLKKKSDSTFAVTPRIVSGDVGENVTCGSGKKIRWELLQEDPNGLEGADFYFRLNIEPMHEGGSPLWWIVGGAAVAGGAAYLILKPTTSTPEQGLPKPVGRP